MKKLILLTAAMAASLYAAPSCDDVMLKSMVDGIKKSAPMQVDSVTVLEGAECKNGSLQYLYSMKNADGINFSAFTPQQMEVFKNVQTNILTQMYCSSLKELHEHTNSVIWTYTLDGKPFAEFELKPSDCAAK